MKICHLIMARGGSRGIPNKNLTKIGDHSLVGYRAISAQKSKHCDRLIISTDSEAIAADARSYGVDVPFMRPAHLATDTASTEDGMVHAVEYLESQGEVYDALMLHEPTSPFATHLHLDEAVAMMVEKQAALVVGMKEILPARIFCGEIDEFGRIPSIIENIKNLKRLDRQAQRKEYTMNGAVYLIEWQFFKAHHQRYYSEEGSYGLIMPEAYSVEIDNPLDLRVAEACVGGGFVDKSYWNR